MKIIGNSVFTICEKNLSLLLIPIFKLFRMCTGCHYKIVIRFNHLCKTFCSEKQSVTKSFRKNIVKLWINLLISNLKGRQIVKLIIDVLLRYC